MINVVVTGSKGFIGKAIIQHLKKDKDFNIVEVDKENMYYFIDNINEYNIHAIIHVGACTDTTEMDYTIHEELNVKYTQRIWNYCSDFNIPLIYASSAATYGDGTFGFDDTHSVIHRLQPLNPYGISKNEFDKWAIRELKEPKYWVGLKFFNVYGYDESHKGKMASMVYHTYNQIKESGKVKLFKSYKNEYKDGGQLRDFVYVKDVVKVIYWMLEKMLIFDWKDNGLYNIGTGWTESFNNVAYYVFDALKLEQNIEYIDMPRDIQNNYQYYTKANRSKLYNAGYTQPFTTLENGVKDYIFNHLIK